MNPETIVNEIRSGSRSDYVSTEPHDYLLICEQALGQGEAQIASMFFNRLNEIEQSIFHFRSACQKTKARQIIPINILKKSALTLE